MRQWFAILACSVAMAAALSACQVIFDDPCGIGSRLEGDSSPPPPPWCAE